MDPKTMQVNMKRFALEINGCKTTGYDEIVFDQEAFPVLAKKGAANDANRLPLVYHAKVAPQAVALDSFQVAQVTFIIGWNTAD